MVKRLRTGSHFDLGEHKVELISKRWQPQKAVSISKHSFVLAASTLMH